MIARRAIVLVVAVLIATVVVRDAAVRMLATSAPAAASHVWPTHPAAEISSAMLQIAQAAGRRQAVPPGVFEALRDAAIKDPLVPEPFLVRGVQAQTDGNETIAERAFAAAQWRDPRSLPAAYFLADHYVRAGDAERGLRQIASLARLAPSGSQAAVPYIASFAANPASWPALRRTFHGNPELAEPVLRTLASNLTTVPAVLALADPRQRPVDSSWFAPLLQTLTEGGRYAEARSMWARATGGPASELLHDPGFADKVSPPPFNWSLTSSTVGLAERQRGGMLQVLFYGQEDGTLASQLLVLPKGSYRLTMKLTGDPASARALNWSIWCDKAAAPIASVTLERAVAQGFRFTVPDTCPAQSLRLTGVSGDIAHEIDATIGSLKLERVTGA